MNILVVCQYFYPEQFRVKDICFELAAQGHNITVLTGLPNYPSGTVAKEYRWFRKRKEEINGVQVIRSWLTGRGKGSIRLALNYLSFALSASIQALSLRKDFDLVLIYQLSPVTMALPGILLKKLTGKPLVLYCHDLWPESIASAGFSSESTLYKLLYRLSRWIYLRADHIFISSRQFEEYFTETLKISGPFIHLPVYAEGIFGKIPPPSEKEGIDLLFAGNIGEMQSVETIIRAARELQNDPSIRFHIVGNGSSLEKCKSLASDLNVKNVFFHGQHPISEMPAFYEKADAFLVTLKKNRAISFTLPNKVQSYLAAGRPVLGAIDGETREVILKAECGLCAPAEDYRELARNIRTFAYNKEQALQWGKNARKFYEANFSKESYLKKLNTLLQNIVKQGDTQNVQG